uniref:Protein kinase domain-containing protein n=3 Tax=Schistocephalus solidus TaxID=70667 RepID=A0A0X3P652_SCHSO
MRIHEIYDITTVLGETRHTKSELAVHKFSEETFVIKRIECKDEQHANDAFEEVLKIKSFRHELFAEIKNVFIQWDEGVSTFYLYIIKQYMKMPNLSSYIKMYQGQRLIPLSFVERVLSSVADILFKMAELNLIHRAIHPGNIFTNEIKVRVSDAVPKSILSDIRSCTAEDQDDILIWAPPESLKCGEIVGKSDVWCLGFVLLHLMHCGTTCERDTLKLLKDAMKKGTIPKNIQNVLEEGYSPQLMHLVLRMIAPDVTERISIEELHAHEYIQALLEFTDSKRKLRRKRMMKPLSECNLPRTGGLRAMLNYLTDNIEHENCAAACLAWVAENACRADADVPDLLPLHVWRAIIVHNENSLVAEHALAILAHCTVVGKMHLEEAKSTASMGPNETTFLETLIDNSTFWNANTFQMIYDLIEKHASVDRVLGNGFALLDAVLCPPGHISFQTKVENAFWVKHGKLSQKLCEMGFVDLILGALRKVREGISELMRPALAVLWKLSVDRKNAKRFIEKGAFVAVYNAMKAYPQHTGILNEAALCVCALASETALTEEALTDLDVSALLLTMVENFLNYPDLCHNALLAMNTILRRSADWRSAVPRHTVFHLPGCYAFRLRLRHQHMWIISPTDGHLIQQLPVTRARYLYAVFSRFGRQRMTLMRGRPRSALAYNGSNPLPLYLPN